jgi:hypothetical protein
MSSPYDNIDPAFNPANSYPSAAPASTDVYTGLQDESGLPLLPSTPSYLVGADNHQLGNTGSSIFDPTTWGDRATHAFEFSVSTLTRAVASTWNSVNEVGKLTGISDSSNDASTQDWLTGMDDDLGQYYAANKAAIDITGDVISMFAPGLGGVKMLNWAQKGVELATEGRAGLNLAAHFGALPTKQAFYAEQAAKDIASSTNTYSLINANLAKSLVSGYAQNALEFAAFNTAAAMTMQQSPLFDQEDLLDIAKNSLIGGGFIGAGVMGTATAVRTIMDLKAAGSVIDKTLNPLKTVLTEPAQGTSPAEGLAIHLNNIEASKDLGTLIQAGDPLATASRKAVSETQTAELNNGRLAAHGLTGSDTELGNTLFDVVSGAPAEAAAQKLAGTLKIVRAGFTAPEEASIANRTLDTTSLVQDVDAAKQVLGASPIGTSAYNAAATKLGTAQDRLAAAQTKIDTAIAQPLAVQYMSLAGSDAGTIYSTAPTVRLADTVKSESALEAVVNNYGHKQGQNWSLATAGGDTKAIESRYIKAMETPFNPDIAIAPKDIPFLESAFYAMKNDNTLENITLKDGTYLDRPGLQNYLEELKGSEAVRLQDENSLAVGERSLNPYDIAKLVNVDPEFLKVAGTSSNPESVLLANQNTQKLYTAQQIAQGNWSAQKGLIKTYLKPSLAKIVYDTSAADKISNHEVSGMVALKEEQTIYRAQALNVTNAYLGEDAPKFAARLPGYLMIGANRESVGGGLLTNQNGNYKTLASYMQEIGSQVSKKLQKIGDNIAGTFAPSGHKLLNDPAAGEEFWKVTQQLRQTPEKYAHVLDYQGEGPHLVNIKQLDYEAALADAEDASTVAEPKFEDTKAPVAIPLTTDGMQTFATDWNRYHLNHATQVQNLRASQGLTVSPDNTRTFYVPPVDGRQYPHFAFVVDGTVNGTGHITTIHAQDAATLEQLASKVPTEQGYKIIYKDQSEEWHQAMKDYDYDLGINDNYINTALKRSGVSAPTFPVTNPAKLWDDMMSWRKNQDSGLLRDMLEHRYSPEFAELRRQGAAYDLAENSRKGYVSSLLKAKSSNPYHDYIKTALYASREGTTPIWSAINRLAQTGVDGAVAKLQAAWSGVKSPADLERINDVLKEIGVSTYQDAATYALANHTAPAPALNNFIRGANALLSFTMLRSDPLNAINNGLGHTVLYGTELPRLIKEVGSSPEGAGTIKDMMGLTVPGTTSQILSPVKLMAKVNGDWWNKVIGGADNSELYKWAKEGGYLPSFTDQFRVMADNLTLRGAESSTELDTRMNQALGAAKKMGQWLETASGNKGVEEYNRFKSAVTAKYVVDAAIAAGKLEPELGPSIINTFVNRVEGVHLAAQRPLMFKGAIGQALGLFQTYQFNMIQQMLRYVGEGDRKAVATLLGLQGSIYGMNGLPAFNAMNTYIVGDAYGNVQHKDIVSQTYGVAGKEMGDWLLYGASSNFMLSPDAKVNMYSRGDINPRQVTVIPTNLADVPIVGAATKFFGSLATAASKIANGGSVWNSLLQGIEHSGVSRPLSGFAQAMEATANPAGKVYSTDNAGNIVMQNDLMSAMTAARLLGAKPLDEAVSLDAYHRVQVYNASRANQIASLASAIKTSVAGGSVPSPEQITDFTAGYMKAGGKQQQFSQFWNRQVVNANKSKVNQMIDNANNSGNQYMQKVMGGYDLSDFNNAQLTAANLTSGTDPSAGE